MLDIRISADASKLLKQVDRMRNQTIPKVQETALNWTAMEVKKALIDEMGRVFDRPKPYTLHSVIDRAARIRKGRMEAHVYLQDFAAKGTPAGEYLQPEIEGGARTLKRMEFELRTAGLLPAGQFVVPAREAPLDAYGNVPSSFIVRMLSDLRAFGQSGYRANRKAGRRTGRRAGNAFFVVPDPGNPGLNGHLRPGIWWRMPNRMLVMVFVFTAMPAYRKRFDFWGIGQATANREYPIRYARAWQYMAKR